MPLVEKKEIENFFQKNYNGLKIKISRKKEFLHGKQQQTKKNGKHLTFMMILFLTIMYIHMRRKNVNAHQKHTLFIIAI